MISTVHESKNVTANTDSWILGIKQEKNLNGILQYESDSKKYK